ncbi:MAG: Ig-like domain-containing protein [Myxococcota bacterium]
MRVSRWAVWATVGFWACGGGGSTTPPAPHFEASAWWGDPGSALPAGAEMVSIDEFLAASKDDGFSVLHRAELETAIAAETNRIAEARRYVDGMVAAHPELAHLLPTAPTLSSTLTALPDGNYLLHLRPSDDGDSEIVLHGADWIYGELASGLRDSVSRAHRSESYASLYAALPDDQRTGLPDPSSLSTISDQALAEAHQEVIRRVQLAVPHEEGYQAAEPLMAHECRRQLWNIYTKNNWPLKAFTPDPSSQGRRGACVAFASLGAMEIRVAHTRDVLTNYSEQELYATAKGFWFPTANAYGELLDTEAVLERLSSTGYWVNAEADWAYNRAHDRVDLENVQQYVYSCRNYPNRYCSDTNHEMRVICAEDAGHLVCAASRPPVVNVGGHDSVKLNGYTSIWNAQEPENSFAALLAHLRVGHPVVLGLEIDDMFTSASDVDPITAGRAAGVVGGISGESEGGHALVAVGYLENDEVIGGELVGQGSGGGYVITKNSWGCKGDGGYMHLSYEWLMNHARSALAITRVETSAIAPTISLSIDKSQLTSPGDIRLTATVNRVATRVEMFRTNNERFVVSDTQLPGTTGTAVTGHYTFSPGAPNGIQVFWARATDQFGNQAYSNHVAVMVNLDHTDPHVTLSAETSTVPVGAPIVLRAQATDNRAIAKVRFFRGNASIATDSTSPYTATLATHAADAGDWPFIAIAYDAAGNTDLSNAVVVHVAGDRRPVVGRFLADPLEVASGGAVTLSWAAIGATGIEIDQGVGDVSRLDHVVVHPTGTTTYRLTASNSFGSSARSVTVTVVDHPDITPPTVSLAAAPTTVIVPGSTLLTATAMDDVGVTQVEFLREGTVFAVDQTPGDGFSASVAFTAADLGAPRFTAKAYDAAGHLTESAPVTVSVQAPPQAERFVGPGGSDAGNDCHREATPCATIQHAVSTSTGAATLWLLDGSYTLANQGSLAANIPPGWSISAKNPGSAVLGFGLQLNGDTLSEIVLDRTAGQGAVAVLSGTNTLAGLRFRGAFTAGSPGLEVSGTASAIFRPGALMNYAAETTSENFSYAPLLSVRGSGALTIEGGTFDGPGVGFGSNPNSVSAGAMAVSETGHLILRNVVLRAVNRGITITGGALDVLDSTIEARAVFATAWGIRINSTNPVDIHLSHSAISGFVAGIGGGTNASIALTTDGAGNHPLANIVADDVQLSGSGLGIYVSSVATASIAATNLRVEDNLLGGIRSAGPLWLRMDQGSISRNGTWNQTTAGAYYGGLTTAAAATHLWLRGVSITDNQSTLQGALTAGNSGLTLLGDGTSSFDLGTGADPGGNIITGNATSASTSGIVVSTGASVVVRAVGNRFQPSTQGSDASGGYALGSGPCGASACDLTTGSGANYRVTSGSLRLAE